MATWLMIVAEGAEHGSRSNELPVPAYTYAIVTAVFFTVALMFTFTYRHVGKARAEAGTADHS